MFLIGLGRFRWIQETFSFFLKKISSYFHTEVEDRFALDLGFGSLIDLEGYKRFYLSRQEVVIGERGDIYYLQLSISHGVGLGGENGYPLYFL